MEDTGKELMGRLDRLYWLLHKQQRRKYTKTNPVSDPTKGQGRILAMLKLQDAISTKDLAFLLDIRVSTLNEMLSKLEKGDYIMREADPSDRRVMLVRLTDKGRNAQQSENTPPADIIDCLDDQEQTNLCDYLDRLIAAIENELEPDSEDFFEHMMALHSHLDDEMMDRCERHRNWHRAREMSDWPDTTGRHGGHGRHGGRGECNRTRRK